MDSGEKALFLIEQLMDMIGYSYCEDHVEVHRKTDSCSRCAAELEYERKRAKEEQEAVEALKELEEESKPKGGPK